MSGIVIVIDYVTNMDILDTVSKRFVNMFNIDNHTIYTCTVYILYLTDIHSFRSHEQTHNNTLKFCTLGNADEAHIHKKISPETTYGSRAY